MHTSSDELTGPPVFKVDGLPGNATLDHPNLFPLVQAWSPAKAQQHHDRQPHPGLRVSATPTRGVANKVVIGEHPGGPVHSQVGDPAPDSRSHPAGVPGTVQERKIEGQVELI